MSASIKPRGLGRYWFSFPLIKLAKKLKEETVKVFDIEEREFPLIKLAKKLKEKTKGNRLGQHRFH